MRAIRRIVATVLFACFATPAGLFAQARVTSPMEQFGHEIGADYVLPDYTQFMAYFQKLAGESDRMVLDTIGYTAEGRPQLMAIITSPANHRSLDRYKEISRRLALAKDLTDAEARQLAADGKAVVWFDGGLHATEVLGAEQLIETVYELVSGNDPETLRFLDDLIILAVHANPDGMELVSDWYMRDPDPMERSTGGIPRLYQKYVGHDNNRDFYASTQPETENMNRIMFREWFPQIVYNHHQSGPAGTVMFAPPFRDPPNYHFNPLIITGIDMVAASMHNRFLLEGKGGVTMRSGASYSTWWNGGLRTSTYFHNMIGLLTETIGNPTPQSIPFMPTRQLTKGDLPLPIEPQPWHFRQSVEYSVTANKGVFDIASRRKDEFLYYMYRMGKAEIDFGSGDHWTDYPKRIDAANEALAAARSGGQTGGGFGGRGGGTRGSRDDFLRLLRAPDQRDARGYILPSDQPDFPTATKFIEALLENGVEVERATGRFQVAGKTYPAGSYVVKTAQAFRPHVLDMFEPQDHPNDFPYPGGPPTPPYDNAGYTLAFQMGVRFDRILDGFDGPFETIEGVDVTPPPGRITGSGRAGWLLGHQTNDAFIVINRLMKAGEDAFWMAEPFGSYEAGTFFIPSSGRAGDIVQTAAQELGLSFEATGSRPAGTAFRLRPVRIGLSDRYGGSMPAGWVRWILEQFEFPYELVFPRTLDAGDLNRQFDVLIFADGGIPGVSGGGGRGGFGGGGRDTASIPAEYRSRLGSITATETVPQLEAFLRAGGTILTIGSSTNLAEHLALPIKDAIVEVVDGEERSVPRTEYYVPGSVLEARFDPSQPLAHGMAEHTDIFFDNSPVFRLEPDAAMKGVLPVAWFDSDSPLRSGWAWGQAYLQDGVEVAEATVGEGKLFLYGPEITFRGQPHGTFKLLFNGIYYGPAERTSVR
ncbi:MAG: M14 family metallopeptidase [Gemmatimonadota bacterium]